MAQIIQTICDICQEAGEQTPGKPIRIEDVQVDLCTEHVHSTTLGVVIDLIEQGHIGARSRQEVADDLTCPHGCNRGKPFASLQGLRNHTTRAHK